MTTTSKNSRYTNSNGTVDSTLSRFIDYLVMSVFAIFALFPFYWMVVTALRPAKEVLQRPPKLWPSEFHFENIQHAFSIEPFADFFKNSLVVAIVAVVITVFINLLAGFSFAKYNFKGKTVLFLIVLSTLMIPQQITMVPNFIIISRLGWLNSYAGLIVPTCAEAFGLFLAKQFMTSIPNELLEAARIDGADEFKIFRTIILPSSKPLISVLIIFTFMWRWNDFLWPLVVVNNKSMYTVQLGLAMMQGENFINWNDLMSASFIVALPAIIVFFIFQKQFVQGVTTTGMKD
jgi:alpha-1,4-digalacturonate transport system permease protein